MSERLVFNKFKKSEIYGESIEKSIEGNISRYNTCSLKLVFTHYPMLPSILSQYFIHYFP